MENIYNFIKIDAESMTHKYMQLSNAIIRAVEDKKIGKNYVMPSINDLSYELDISRSTCEKAYNHLKKIGIVGSVPGKGFFIADTGFNQNLKVLLLLNKLSAHKKLVYDSFASKLGDRAAIDLYIYNNDFSLFRKILSEKIGHYTHYVIIPPFIDGVAKAAEIISKIPDDQLILLDKLLDNNQGNFCAVYENFGSDIYHALKKAVRRLRKYDRIKLIFPEYSYYPQEIIEGFKEFCKEFQFEQTILAGIEDEIIEDGTVYIKCNGRRPGSTFGKDLADRS